MRRRHDILLLAAISLGLPSLQALAQQRPAGSRNESAPTVIASGLAVFGVEPVKEMR